MSEPRLNLAFTGISSFLRSPVCTDLSQLDADIAFLGFPTDEGSGWLPGSRLGPRKVREMSLRFASGATGDQAGFWDIDEDKRYLAHEMGNDRIRDCGDVDVIYTRPDLSWDNATAAVQQILAAGAMPIVAGGDHAITYSIVRAYDGPVQVVHFDAHIDYQPFIHGVEHSHGNPIRMLRKLDNVTSIVQVGIRSFRTAEQDYRDAVRDGNRVLTTRQYQRDGVTAIGETLDPDIPTYVSVDVDVLDIALAPGVATPEPSGLSYDELRDALVYLAENFPVCGLDVVEINPMLDTDSHPTSFLSTQLMIEFIAHAFADNRRGNRPVG